ncbi:MAG: erythromycin esterase [Acidobacteriota bacterium]|nr:erythromycin esterase [Acidobacteriota bacterium]
MRRPPLMVLALLVLSLSPAWAAPRPAHPFLDFDFEASECTSGWLLGGRSFEWALDSSTRHSGRQSLRMEYLGAGPWSPNLLAISLRSIPAAEFAGRHIRLTGWIRTEDVDFPAGADAGTGLWWRADGEDEELALANSEAGRGTTPWTRYTLEMDVPAETKTIFFGVFLAGSGRAWFDSLGLEVDGKPWVEGKPPSTAQPTSPAVAWLRKKAIPFRTPEAGNGFADLQPLRKLIGDARIVSLGEDTHGTREFFQMKHRLVEFLASEMGFTLFAIEANMPEAYRMNDYVLTGKGDPRELLKGMYFWTWNTQEVLDMVEWMRAFNQSGKGRIQFLGFDMQYPGVAAGIVNSFVAKAEPDYSREAGQNLTQVQTAIDALHHGGRNNGQLGPVADAARSVYEHLAGRRDAYLARFPREDVDWAIQNARVVLQSVQYFTGPTYRDESMANNIEWILDQNPGEKIVLWAHNLHVGKQDEQMGEYLAERYGRDMVVLGFAFGQGRYNAVGLNGPLGPQVASSPIPGSVESYLAAPGLPRFIVDLRGIPGSAPSSPWFKKERLFRNIGAVEDRCGFSPDVAAGEFDGLIWFDQTSPSVLLPF